MDIHRSTETLWGWAGMFHIVPLPLNENKLLKLLESMTKRGTNTNAQHSNSSLATNSPTNICDLKRLLVTPKVLCNSQIVFQDY